VNTKTIDGGNLPDSREIGCMLGRFGIVCGTNSHAIRWMGVPSLGERVAQVTFRKRGVKSIAAEIIQLG